VTAKGAPINFLSSYNKPSFNLLDSGESEGSSLESPMAHRSIRTSAGEPSFFYLMMARTCFQSAAKAVHPKGGATLRNIGRGYLMKATSVASDLEAEPARTSEPDRAD
jgi:hypothetical protein